MANPNVMTSVTLDVYNYDTEQPSVKAIAGDSVSRYVSAYLTDRDSAYNITDNGSHIKLIAMRPDHTVAIGYADVHTETAIVHPEYFPQERITYDDEGNETVEYYYVDENGVEINVSSLDPIPEETEDRSVLVGELTKEMLAVPGTATCQFKIITQTQTLHTSFFKVMIGRNLEDQGSYISVDSANLT